jgi:hypothetical protein
MRDPVTVKWAVVQEMCMFEYSMMEKSNEYCTSDLKNCMLRNVNFIASFPLMVVMHGWVSMYVLSANRGFHDLLSLHQVRSQSSTLS